MRSLFNIVLSLLLVLPVVAVAMPCNMQMNVQEIQSSPLVKGDMPCMSHQSQVVKTCDQTMSMADCYDLELISSSADVVKLPTYKMEIPTDFALSDAFSGRMLSQSTQSRAPPLNIDISHAQPSLILTTHRFRV